MSRNPFTPLRRQLQQLKADTELMLQEVILLELYHQGAELALDDQGEAEEVAGPVELKVEIPRRRGRRPAIEAPPPAPVEPGGDELPRPRRGRPPREPRIPGAGFEPA